MNVHQEQVSYRIDDGDAIISVGDDWDDFAITNGAPELAANVVGRSLWEFISDSATRQLYRELLHRVRSGRPVTFAFRCDSSDRRRFMQMTMRSNPEHVVEFESVTVRTEHRRPIAALARTSAVGTRLVHICSWCKRVGIADGWEEIEVAISRLDMFADATAPSLTHGICPDCLTRVSDPGGHDT